MLRRDRTYPLDAKCRCDNARGTPVCSRAYPSPPRPEGWAPLDLPAVTVDVADAVAAVAAVGRLAAMDVDAHPGSRPGMDALLRTVRGRPVWAVSQDVWAEVGRWPTDASTSMR